MAATGFANNSINCLSVFIGALAPTDCSITMKEAQLE